MLSGGFVLSALGCAGSAVDSTTGDVGFMPTDGIGGTNPDEPNGNGNGEPETCAANAVQCGDVCCPAAPPSGTLALLGPVTDGRIAVSVTGAPHIVFRSAGGELRHAGWGDGGWSVTRIDPSGGHNAAIAVDASGNPHVCYSRGDATTTSTLYYARFAGQQWLFSSWPDTTGKCAIAVTSNGTPHLLFQYNGTSPGLVYTRKESSGWKATRITASRPAELALAVDSKS
ncbi:MAG: hypothetical protein KC417_04265, partial [Myxococcales bacterium]|nr:hypothetical protein [Myxococcales bacterium]